MSEMHIFLKIRTIFILKKLLKIYVILNASHMQITHVISIIKLKKVILPSLEKNSVRFYPIFFFLKEN
jgi:hypothetical protein